MPTVVRSYNHPDVLSVISSRESSTSGGCKSSPFAVTELAKRKEGMYTGVSIDGYHARRRQGGLLPFSYYERYDITSTQSGRAKLTWKPNYCSETAQWSSRIAEISNADLFTPWPQAILTLTDMYDAYEQSGLNPQLILQRSAAKIWEGFDLGTFTGEIGRTLQMVLGLRRRAAALLARKPKGVMPALKDLSGVWLEWYYGWRLLAKDANAITRELQDQTRAPVVRQKMSQESVKTSNVETLTTNVRANGETYDLELTRDFEVSVKATFVGMVDMDLSVYVSPITMWELIPYSFVIDWFINIGQAINSLMATLVATHYESCYGVLVSGEFRGAIVDARHNGSSLVEFEKEGSSLSTGQLKLRQPAKVNNLPRFNPHLSWERALSGVALLLQRLK